jgi:L-seryl-tRNA(Ser) seleniumtransferase
VTLTQMEHLYRMLPAVHELLPTHRNGDRVRRLQVTRQLLEELRDQIAEGRHSEATLQAAIRKLPEAIEQESQRAPAFSLRRVINATGVILHTNLGRAPLSRKAIENVSAVAAGYSNLEFDLEKGGRGRRDVHVEAPLIDLFTQVTGKDLKSSHRAIVVNNCAAATFLALHALARGKQVIVSRSELVEIGGGFRIPDILEQSGAILREVGTTNRTRVTDYSEAITEDTALILRVHQSNFSMEGFVERPSLGELVALAKRSGVSLFEDQGTGLIHALGGEPTFSASIAAGCTVVAASGDKLLGGPQCGILIGQREAIEAMRKDSLYRALRMDKLGYAALEATLFDYLRQEPVPILSMLNAGRAEIRHRCEEIVAQLESGSLVAEIVGVESVIGGGTAPRTRLPGYAIALKHARLGAEDTLQYLRGLQMPIVGRIEDDWVLLDLRTVEPELDDRVRTSLELLARA